MKNINTVLGKKILRFDGALGTMIQAKGDLGISPPELLNIHRPDVLEEIHQAYLDAGADVILANTFGANRLKLDNTEYSVKEVVSAGINIGKSLGDNHFVAMDVGPLGQLLEPFGTMTFDEAYQLFKEMVVAGEEAGADLVVIETMNDTYEMKAAILATKENTNLPIFATMTFDESGKLLTGGDVASVVALLEGLGVSVLGLNCGAGPEQMKPIVEEFLKLSSSPIMVCPNAGLPKQVAGQTIFDLEPKTFGEMLGEFAQMGVWCLGGCCGTTPEHIAMMSDQVAKITPKPIESKPTALISSYAKTVSMDRPIMIGESLNPTGKQRLKSALKNRDFDYILREGIMEMELGMAVLDVNVGLPEIDEKEMMVEVVTRLQAVVDTPLQIDSSNPKVIEAALRYYNGKAMINSVNGKIESMEAIFPLVKKYGGVVVALTLDESGIPSTVEGRVNIAKKIVEHGKTYGIDTKDIVIDPLAMPVGTGEDNGRVTLDTIGVLKNMGLKTILGVSNVSFGLPQREILNGGFYALALGRGLDCGIVNPRSQGIKDAFYTTMALLGKDPQLATYMSLYSGETQEKTVEISDNLTLEEAIIKGLGQEAYQKAKVALGYSSPLEVIDQSIVPALDRVGQDYEAGRLFLPQLLMGAEAARFAFDAVKAMLSKAEDSLDKGLVVLATVEGDIHDIGKNIVKVLLENYGYSVLDLGKDVKPEVVLEAVRSHCVKLVGLSALMTTTVCSMEEVIKLVKTHAPHCKIMVGGAVLTKKYAYDIGADFYAKDAMGGVRIAEGVFDQNNN